MKVYGQLDAAQLEQVTGTGGLATPTGRMVVDITNPLAAVPKMYNGTAWQQFMQANVGGIFSQNSGTSCTVNWANGVTQQVILTGNCVISFSNPVAGQIYQLIVTQNPLAPTSPQFMYTFNMIDQDTRRMGYQPTQQLLPSQNQFYVWYYSPAIKPGYATVPNAISIPNAAFLPAVASLGMAMSPDGKFFSIGTGTTPFGGVLSVIEGGGRPQIMPFIAQTAWAGNIVRMAFSPDGQYLFAASATTPFIQARPTMGALQGGYGQGLAGTAGTANPATLPAGTSANSVAVHPLGAWVAVGSQASPFIQVYPFDSGNGFGTKLGNPATLPVAIPGDIAWSPQGDYLAVAQNATAPFLQVYPFTITMSGSSLVGAFGTVCANPSTPPVGGPQAANPGKQIAWRPQGDYIAMVSTTTLYVVAFNRATGVFGAAAVVSYVATSNLNCLQWTPDGQYIVCGSSNPANIIVLDFSSGSIGASAVALDGTAINQTVNDICIAPHGEWAACALASTPFFKIISLPTKVRNYMKLVM